MSDKIFDDEEPKKLSNETVTQVTKPKKKRQMSEEQRQRLLENLKRGRETAMRNRKRRAEAKRLEKQNKVEKIEKMLTEQKPNNNCDLKDEIQQLKLEIAELKKSRFDVKPVKPVNDVVVKEEVKEDVIFYTFKKPRF